MLFFSIKALLIIKFFIWIRATLPRYRYDQLIKLCWRNFLVIAVALFSIYHVSCENLENENNNNPKTYKILILIPSPYMLIDNGRKFYS